MALKEKALKRLAEKLNAAGVCWALCGDFVRCRRGQAQAWHTFELVCAERDRAKADQLLTRLGMRHEEADGSVSYHFDGADITLYSAAAFAMTADTPVDTEPVLGVPVPMLTAEELEKVNG